MTAAPAPATPDSGSQQPILEARGISKYFGAVTALRGVDFKLYRGEVLGVVGDNGAGKSTLMKILSGLYVPSEGQLLFEGRPIRFHSPREARDLGIEMVYQDLALAENLNIAENIFLGREPRRGRSMAAGRGTTTTVDDVIADLNAVADQLDKLAASKK